MNPSSILCIRFSSLGDILLTLPALELLRKEFPETKISYLTKESFAPILRNHRDIDELILLKKKESLSGLRNRIPRSYDIIIDWHNSFRSRALRWLLSSNKKLVFNKPYFRRFLLVNFKIDTLKEWPPVFERYAKTLSPLGIKSRPGTGYLLTQEDYFTNEDQADFIFLAPGANWFTKRWPAKKYMDLGDKLIKKGYNVGLIGSDMEFALGENIASNWPKSRFVNFCGKISLDKLPSLIKMSKAVVSNDSALMHMAAIAQVPVVGVFTSTTKSLGFTPPGSLFFRAEADDISCRPCSHIGLAKCPKDHFNCAEMISVEKVLLLLDQILKPAAK